MKFRTLLTVISLFSIYCFIGFSRTGAQSAPNTQPEIYIALGDSVATGIGSSLPRTRSYPAILDAWMAKLNGSTVTLANLSRPGETAASFLANGQFADFQSKVNLAQATGIHIEAVTLTLGGNELLNLQDVGIQKRKDALDEFKQTYGSVLEQVRSEIGPDATLVVTTYYDVTEGDASVQFSNAWWIAQYNEAIADGANNNDAIIADLAATFTGNISDYTRYPIDPHPTNQGYRAIAELVWTDLHFDTNAPLVDAPSSVAVQRLTPTLRWQVSEDVEIANMTTQTSDGLISKAFPRQGNEVIALLDLHDVQTSNMSITIKVSDRAGNTTMKTTNLTISDTASLDDGSTP